MPRYILGRILQAVLVLWAAFSATFAILFLLPSDPLQLQLGAAGIQEDSLSKVQVHQLEHQYGLDQSAWMQYWHHLTAYLHGNLGTSLAEHEPVSQLIGQRVGQTLLLSVCAGVLSLVVGSSLAYLATLAHWRPLRVFLTRLPAVGASFPQFLIALFLIQFFSFQAGWFPSTGTEGFSSLVLPTVTISLLTSSVLAQVLIKSFDETLRQPYIITARAKGLSRTAVHTKHVARNAALPAMTILGVLVGLTVTSSVVTETVFTRNGLGSLAQQSVLSQDVPVVLAIVTLAATLFVVVNLAVDLLYPKLDPRISRGTRRRRISGPDLIPEVSVA